MPRSSAKACSASIRSQSAFASRCAWLSASSRLPCGGLLAAAVLAGEQAVGQREVGDQAHPDVLQRGDQLLLGGPVVQRVLVLRGDERAQSLGARGPVRVHHLPGREVRAADVPDLALGHELGQRLERLRDRGDQVGLVKLVEVDVVGAEPAQAGLDRAPHVAPGGPGTPVRAVRAAHVHAELGGHHHVLTALAERPAEQLLARADAVGVRGVEERDAGVQRGIDHPLGLLGVDPGAERVGAEPDGGHHQPAGPEGAVGHVAHVPSQPSGGNRHAGCPHRTDGDRSGSP